MKTVDLSLFFLPTTQLFVIWSLFAHANPWQNNHVCAWAPLPSNITNMIYVVICPSVSFPGHPRATSPPNPIDKISNPECSHSGFSGHSKIESSKVGHAVSFNSHCCFVYFFHMCNQDLIVCEMKWRVENTGNGLFTRCAKLGGNCDVCVSVICSKQRPGG